MSHYLAGVITATGDTEEVALAMAPFNENLNVEQLKDEDDGSMYWHNPQGHWDWYEIGGRWPGELRSLSGWLNPDAAWGWRERGTGLGNGPIKMDWPGFQPRACDGSPIDQIDWDGVGAAKVEAFGSYYDDIVSGKERAWGGKYEPRPAEETRLEFVRRRVEPFSTYSMIDHKGEWHAKPESDHLWEELHGESPYGGDQFSEYMKWSDGADVRSEVERRQKLWPAQWQKILRAAPEGSWIWMVDYHS